MSVNHQETRLPASESGARHVAIIMDGNGRWASHRGKLRIFGHKAGVRSVRRAVSFAATHHIDVLTLYAFSSENWHRPAQEVNALMELFVRVLDTEIKNIHKNNVKLCIVGDISRFNKRLQECIHRSETLTANNDGLILNIAANYGGRWDIVQGVRRLAEDVKKGKLQPGDISEELLNSQICLNEQVQVDLVIRTGGEHRLSNFLLWQAAYAEFYFTDVLWPDFDEIIFESALNAFAKRERRFGGASPSHDGMS